MLHLIFVRPIEYPTDGLTQHHQATYFDEQLMEELHHGARILLAYFHHSNKGCHPFTMDWASPDQVVMGEFTLEQREFMRELSAELEKHG